MTQIKLTPATLIAGAVLLMLAYIWLRGVKRVASDVVGVIGEAVVSTAEGVVIGTGKIVGVPETDPALCEQYVNAGEWMKASAYCPAGTFLKKASGEIFNLESREFIGYTDEGEPEFIMLN